MHTLMFRVVYNYALHLLQDKIVYPQQCHTVYTGCNVSLSLEIDCAFITLYKFTTILQYYSTEVLHVFGFSRYYLRMTAHYHNACMF